MQTIHTISKNCFRLQTSKLIVLYILVAIYAFSANGQGQTCKEELFPLQDENRKSGYVNAFGEWKIRPFYTKAFPFRGKVAIVLSGTEHGVINCEGDIVFKPQFQELKEYSGGVTWAKKENNWGIISDTGSIITDFKYSEIKEVGSYTYVTWVRKDLKWQLLSNFSGKPINKDFFDEIKVLNFQTSLVKKEMLIGLLNNENGNYIIQPDYQKVFKIAPNVFTAVKNNKWFLFNDDGNALTNTSYDSVAVFGKFRFLVKKEGKYGVLDYHGNIITPIQFKQIEELSNMHFVAQEGKQYAYYNIYGNKVKGGYDYAESFHDGIALAKDTSFKILNLFTKKVHVLSNYDTVYRQAKTHNFVAKKGNDVFLLNTKGEKTIPTAYGSIHLNANSDWIYLTTSDGCHFYNTKTKHQTPYFDSCENFKYNYAVARKNEAWLVIDQSGKELGIKFTEKPRLFNIGQNIYAGAILDDELQLYYLNKKRGLDKIDGREFYASGNYISIKEKGDYKLISQEGEEVIKPKYDTIITTWDHEWPKIISEKGSYNLINKEGDLLHKKGFSSVEYFTDDMYLIRNENKYGLINSKGNFIIPIEYDSIKSYAEYYLLANKNGKWGYLNLKNQIRIPFIYSKAYDFKNQVAVVKINNNHYQVIDKRGVVLEKGFTTFLINEDQERELRNSEFILKIKEGRLIKSYNYLN